MKSLKGIATPVIDSRGDVPGLLDTEPCSRKTGANRYRRLTFALMRSEKALAIFAEHGLEPATMDDGSGLTWDSAEGIPMTDTEYHWAVYRAHVDCYETPELRPLYERHKHRPEGRAA